MLKTVIPLNNIVLFPKMIVTFDITNTLYVDILNDIFSKKESVFVTLLKTTIDFRDDTNLDEFLCDVGVICDIVKISKISDDVYRIFAQTGKKAYASSFKIENDKIIADVTAFRKEKVVETVESKALFSSVKDHFMTYVSISSYPNQELIKEVQNSDDMERVSNMIAHAINISIIQKQSLLEEKDVVKRLFKLLEILTVEINKLSLRNDILNKVRQSMDENQRRYFLREEMKVIQEELGETNSIDEILAYEEKINNKGLNDDVKEKLNREVYRLKRGSSNSAETSNIKDYLDRVLDLPWGEDEKTDEINDIKNARKILDKDHFGLAKVKERIIEFLAVKSYSKDINSPVLCLVGPPGVGKTSIAKSIAKATGRKYSRISLGGVKDESDIRGHRRTYIGAMPGRIITSISKTKVNNPLILLDEIDKMGKDIKGDPAAALLEVLDPEQNKTFTDHYIGLEFDISNVLFICTANTINDIPNALRDRLEIIHLSSYTNIEKENIAKKFLFPKQLSKHNLDKSKLKIKNEVFSDIVNYYTREAGVRNLDQQIAKICRKVVTDIVEGKAESIGVNSKNLNEFLGEKRYFENLKNDEDEIGVVRGLAYTSVGGTTLSIETVKLEGTGKLEFTGNLGKIMQESAKASMSYIRSRREDFCLPENFYKEVDIHIHVPEGATPKDGPSAGTAITTSIVSALTGKYVKSDIAMTGEVTISGRVLPIGGLKEKLLAAKNANIRKVFIPFKNKPDYDELEDYIKNGIEVVLVSNVKEILDDVLITK